MRRTIDILRFIKKNRSRKKKKLYRMAFGVALDKTISVYLGLFVVLFLIILYDQLQLFESLFLRFERVAENYLSWIIIGWIARTLIISNEDPGIRVTNAEYKLSTLTYSMKQIWNILFFKKITRTILYTTVFFSLLFFLTPLTNPFVIKIYLITLVSALLLILPQWYFHSFHGMKRWVIYFCVLLFIAISRLIVITQMIPEQWMVSLMVIILLMIQFYIYPKRFKEVSWPNIAGRNDQKEWNMMIVRFMSDTKTKPLQRKSAWKDFYQRKKMRQPFSYSRPSLMYRRIWFKGLQEHVEYVTMIFIYFALCVILTSFKGELVQGLGMVAAIFMYVKMIGSLFLIVFQYPLFQSIPWNKEDIKRSFMFFVYTLGKYKFFYI